MTTKKLPWNDIFPDPFRRDNPFALLGASPECTAMQLSARASELQLVAESTEVENAYRDALRELTTDPILRAAWEVFTPSVSIADARDESTAFAGQVLGQHLLGRGEVPELVAAKLRIFATWLGWPSRLDSTQPATSRRQAADLWQRSTHVFGADWKYWHQLALLYYEFAWSCEYARAAVEAACSLGKPTETVSDVPLDAIWLRAFLCWKRVLADDAFWRAIREHVSLSPAFDPARFEQLAGAFLSQMVSTLAQTIEDAVVAGNRLAAVRRWRLLLTLASQSALAEDQAMIMDAQDRVRGKLWGRMNHLEDDPRQQFLELAGGLLLFDPDDERTVAAAFQAFWLTARHESVYTPDAFTDSTRMSRILRRHLSIFERRVLTATKQLAPQAQRNDRIVLSDFYSSRLSDIRQVGNRFHEDMGEYDERLQLVTT